MTQHLFQKYYYSKPGYAGGTKPFHDICASKIRSGSKILEIGAGPSNPTTAALSRIGSVTGVDVDPAVRENTSCIRTEVYDGSNIPFPDNAFDACVSNWVLEHLAAPETHFKEVARVLRPNGVYCFRTMNLFHYVTLGSRLTPHLLHLILANRLRGLSAEAHDPYSTFYRANMTNRLKSLIHKARLETNLLELIEPEPSYGRIHAALFYPMMIYERIVNSTSLLRNLRIIIFGVCTKHRGIEWEHWNPDSQQTASQVE
jgi:ubiquinone/menaquinone biosynthesis C-methylase UbiE